MSTLPVTSWPVASRFALGGHLHRILTRVGMEALRMRLADDAVAAGFAVAAITSPHGREDLSFAADLLTSLNRPDALALVADAEEYGPSERLGADEDWPSARVPVDAERRAALACVVRDAPDPWRALLAARVLAPSEPTTSARARASALSVSARAREGATTASANRAAVATTEPRITGA